MGRFRTEVGNFHGGELCQWTPNKPDIHHFDPLSPKTIHKKVCCTLRSFWGAHNWLVLLLKKPQIRQWALEHPPTTTSGKTLLMSSSLWDKMLTQKWFRQVCLFYQMAWKRNSLYNLLCQPFSNSFVVCGLCFIQSICRLFSSQLCIGMLGTMAICMCKSADTSLLKRSRKPVNKHITWASLWIKGNYAFFPRICNREHILILVA